MRNPTRIVVASIAVLAAQGCSSSPNGKTSRASEALEGPPTCEGLAPEECLLPWPSSRFLVRDTSTATGYRVSIPAAAMPKNVMDSAVDPGPWNRWDGFSPMTAAMAQLPVRIDPAPLADYRHVAQSLDPSSPTILFDATARTRVAHWAEVEAAADADPNRTTLYIRPAARLAENHRYVVVVRRLKAMDGTLYEGKKGKLDEGLADSIDDAGVERSSVALAWDFRTASGSSAWGDLLAMRNDAAAFAGNGGLGCTVTNAIDDPNDANVFRRIEGTITVPMYLDESGLIARDGNGTPQRTGTTDIAFTAVIPRSVAVSGTPARLVTFEHGLLTDRNEVLRDFMVKQANDYPMVLAATDLTGLAAGDEQMIGMSLFDLNGFSFVMDRLAQSIVGTLLLPRTIAGACSAQPAFQVDGKPVVDGSRRYYYGISQGGNFGPTFAALSDDMDQFVMSVGGISYPVMITRSVHWPDLEEILAAGYPSRIQRDLMMVMFAHHWERVEGSAFAPHVLEHSLVGAPKHVLAQTGLYDVQTPNEGSHLAARTMDLPQASYDASPVFGLKTYATTSANAYVTFDMGAAVVPPSTTPPSADNGVHEAVRRDPRAQKQIDGFLRPGGMVIDACGGPCR